MAIPESELSRQVDECRKDFPCSDDNHGSHGPDTVQPMPERFFRAIALAGDLYLTDLKDWDEWDPARLRYHDEAEATWLTRISPNDRRIVLTVAELDAAIQESASPRGIYLYVGERLIDEARRRWEEMKQRQ